MNISSSTLFAMAIVAITALSHLADIGFQTSKNERRLQASFTVIPILIDGEGSYSGEYNPTDVAELIDRHGSGTMRYLRDNIMLYYQGGWQDDQFHDQGTLVWTDGRKYVGGFDNGQFHRHGHLTWSNGAEYVGDWVDGQQQGQGTMTYDASGNVYYEGAWHGNERHGRGKYRWSSGEVYDGEWVDGKRRGQGTMTYAPSGDVYVGQWQNNQRHGRGIYRESDGSAYDGEWLYGEKQGSGKHIFPDKSYWEGQLKEGKKGRMDEFPKSRRKMED